MGDTMTTNILFVDVDGTLVTAKDGKQFIPPSALDALAQVRAHGDLETWLQSRVRTLPHVHDLADKHGVSVLAVEVAT